MNQYRRIALGAAASVGLALVAAAAFAHPGGMGGMGGMGAMGSMQGMGAMGGMHGGMPGPMMHGGPAGQGIGQHLMTPEEREALHEKMRNATTPEERQALAAATHAEMEKRAKEKGLALPDHRGQPQGMGLRQGPGVGQQSR